MHKVKILIVEDELIVAQDIKMSLQRLGSAISGIAFSREEAIKKAEEIHPDLVLMDTVLEKQINGLQTAKIIHSRFDIPIEYLADYADDKTLEQAKITEPFGYILKLFEDKDLYITLEMTLYKHKIENMLKESEERLRRNLKETVHALASAVEMRDPYTAGHQHRVTNLACAIAEEMGLAKEQIDVIRMAGIIHDLGKIQIPAEILNMPGPLAEIPFRMIETHPQVGHDILKTLEFPYPIAQIIFQHHERMDGSGYPAGLSGEDILMEARILAVSDVVEAIALRRPYRAALGINRALKEILKKKDVLYDWEVVDACLKLFKEKSFKFISISKNKTYLAD